MKIKTKSLLKTYALELGLYAVLVLVYFFLVLHFLAARLVTLHHEHPSQYAIVALGLIVGQGIFLEYCTRFLLGWLRRRGGN